ncbi:MAG: hypothetical protein DHS20C15_33480 [Planctomycetota bacterium]|nr:MAG: hypothetical protein DHS20C15_33480 [Planctomycetota bacterium]
MRVVRDAQPRTFLIENVPGLAYQRKDDGLTFIQRSISAINRATGSKYQLSIHMLNSAAYGVPQERERLFLIAHRDGLEFSAPPPTHGPPGRRDSLTADSTGGRQLSAFTTAWDAIGDLEDADDPDLKLTGKWADLLPSIPEGKNYLHHTARGGGKPLFGWRRRYWSFLLKLAKRLPSWTITANPGSAIGPFHWNNRRLSMRELCRIQTIPDDYYIVGSRQAYQKQIGNAVPSALAETLGIHIRRTLLNHRVKSRGSTLTPEFNRPHPPSSRPGRVPKKYSSLIGEYPEHPGAGLGPGALSRDT